MAKRSLTYEQMISKLVIICIIIIYAFSAFGYISSTKRGLTNPGLTIGVIVAMIITIISDLFIATKHPKLFKNYSIWSFALVYCISIFFATTQHLYVIVFPVILLFFLYFDFKLVRNIAIVYTTINALQIVYTIMTVKAGTSPREIDITGFFIQLSGVAIFTIFFAIATKISNENNASKLESIKHEQEKSASLLDDVLGVVEVVTKAASEADENMRELRESVESTSRAIGEISAGNENNALSIERQTNMTTHIQEMIEQVRNMSNGALNNANETAKSVNEGRLAIDQLIKQSERSAEAHNKVVATVDAFIERAKMIDETTQKISAISSQTNLLALNASIESARAGDYGRGFAVVATEIGKLAEQTKELTQTIRVVVDQLTAEANEARESVNTVIEVSECEKELIKSANDEFNAIGGHSGNLSKDVEDICTKIEEVYSSNNSIVDSITSISAVSEEVSAGTVEAVNLGEQCAERARRVSDLMQELTDSVKRIDTSSNT